MRQLRTGIAFCTAALLVMVMAACSNNAGQAKVEASTETDFRLVNSENGEIKIPAHPARVVGLSVVYPEFLQALGITPVAVQNYQEEFPTYLQEPFKDTLKMGIAKTPNFEMILSSNPDIILAPAWWAGKDYDQLSGIAPTVLLPERQDWRDELKDIAEVLDKKEAAEKVIQELEAQEAEAKLKLDALVGNETVMYMMVMPGSFVLYGDQIDRGKFIHTTLGLEMIPNFPAKDPSLSISLEKLPEYNPDHLILQLNNEDSPEVKQTYEDMLNSPLWKNMKAVKNNQVYMMAGKDWFNLGMSPLANRYAIDAVLGAFGGNSK
ncbi:ABC transporter substrate-binding protein [Paenibacillus tritici]|uniref:ABC transporter substrate-binding protein n=1 Tax=Paenibacillus tritici TaxID=1873425 RepID=A0ABX2DHF3_9BACL|nr:ABC transporter substrate-binding protein [Paenibacillus tritici]NQX44040.1 ABC transporter substrate-binding protein [Paenibacillus tritici]